MEVKQFYNRTISPLVSRTWPCKWSPDDRLALVTEKVLHVLEIKPAPHQASPILDVSRSLVNAPRAVPADFYADAVLSRIFEWPRERVLSFLMNDLHTPVFPKAKALRPEIVDVFWSPRGLLHPRKCLLAVLTSAGALELAVQIDKTWISICELKGHWLQVVEPELRSFKDAALVDTECLREHLNRLLVSDAAWSNLRHEQGEAASFAFLATAHRNGEIAVWKVSRVLADTVHLDTRVNVEFKFRKRLVEHGTKVHSMLWVDTRHDKLSLFLGLFSGQIAVLILQEFEGGLTSSSYSTCYRDEDGIAVDSMQVLRRTDEQLELAVVKGMHLLLLAVDGLGKTLATRFVTSPGFSITGASVLDSSSILITTQDARVCVVQQLANSRAWACVPLKSDAAKAGLQYLGLASSRNKLLHVLVSSPSVVYDHLSNREPTNLCFFAVDEAQPRDLVRSLYDRGQQCLVDSWDYLELIKVQALKRGLAAPAAGLKMEHLDFMSPHELKVSYWILSIMDTVKRRNCADSGCSPAREIEQAKTYVFLHGASSYLQLLAERERLSDTQALSASLVRSYLAVWHAGEEEEEAETALSGSVGKVLAATRQFDSTHREACAYCEDRITEPWAPSCPRGHKLPRCALTRLQVTGTKYRTCPVCRELYHPCLDALMSEVRCIYCDVPAVYKHLRIDSELLASARNLSKDKLVFIGSNRDKDKEKDEEDGA